MDYGSSDTSTTSLGANQFPISETWTPNAGFSALEGGPQSTDLGGKKSAPASMYVKDGSDVAQGTTTDAANANTVVGQLKQIQTNTSGNATAANQTTANTSLSSVATNTSNTATNTSNINVATGAKADSAATDSTSSWSVIALLKGIYAKLAGTLGISGTVTANAGTGTFTNQQSNVQADYDTTAGTQNVTMMGVALPASGGAVPGGTSSNPLKTDPTGTTTQPVSQATAANLNATATIQAATGTALAADQTNSELRTSVYGKNVTAGDTAIATDASGNVGTNVIGALPAGANNIGKVNIQASGTSLAADNTNELRVSAYVKKTVAGDTSLTLGQATMANSLPVTMASDQGAVPVSGTITANAGTNLNTSLLALESGGHLANIDTHTPALGSATSANSSPVVIASDQGAVALKRSTVAVYSLASTVTSGATQNSGDLTVAPYTEISIDINTTAQAGTSPTLQLFYERKGADSIYYVLWQSAVLTAAANTISTSIGAGMAYNQSLGATGRVRWVVGGTATPTFTMSINVQGK